jgi:hypothetical protein
MQKILPPPQRSVLVRAGAAQVCGARFRTSMPAFSDIAYKRMRTTATKTCCRLCFLWQHLRCWHDMSGMLCW